MGTFCRLFACEDTSWKHRLETPDYIQSIEQALLYRECTDETE